LIGGEPAAVNTRAVSMWVQAAPPLDGISAVTLQKPLRLDLSSSSCDFFRTANVMRLSFA